MGGGDDFGECGLAASEERREVACQCGLEGLLAVPLRVLGGQRLEPIEGKGKLEVEGLFGP